jgi:hypothetical protein
MVSSKESRFRNFEHAAKWKGARIKPVDRGRAVGFTQPFQMVM